MVSKNPTFQDFFRHCCGYAPFPYQERLALSDWPELLDVQTGLGKTAAVVIAWLWKRLQSPDKTPRRLVYCLPMRVLTEQVKKSVKGWLDNAAAYFPGQTLPTIHTLMGGSIDNDWIKNPERPAILIGTQDQLISRALNRGYATSRFTWPMHFGLLHDDAFWVMDETQLMGVSVETSAQLQGLRTRFGSWRPTHTLWMSATLASGQIDTVDHSQPASGWTRLALDKADHEKADVQKRLNAKKPISCLDALTITKTFEKTPKEHNKLAEHILQKHQQGTLTLVIVNRVVRAQRIYEALQDTLQKQKQTHIQTALIHSRFRPSDRTAQENFLSASGDRIIIATQAIEAGVDVSARVLITEIAPWPSMVQRFGRCNRRGEDTTAAVYWIDIEDDEKVAKPYALDLLQKSRAILTTCSEVGPHALSAVTYTPEAVVRPVLRARDLKELFDTSPDIMGDDIDISRFVRDSQNNDVQVFWRALTFENGKLVDKHESDPKATDNERCAVGIGAFRAFLDALEKARDKTKDTDQFKAWTWDALDGAWIEVAAKPKQTQKRPYPGMVVMLSEHAGGYDPKKGWTGNVEDSPVHSNQPTEQELAQERENKNVGDDTSARSRQWVPLTDHLQHVGDKAQEIVSAYGFDPRDPIAQIVTTAARWHDVGKAHAVFQKMLCTLPPPIGDQLWAKSNHRQGRCKPKHFRHELASALAWLAHHPQNDQETNLTAFLIASHHGQVRVTLRSLPSDLQDIKKEKQRQAYGVKDGDKIPSFVLPDGTQLSETTLSLSLMDLGEGSWFERILSLRDLPELGPFRLALLEALLRAADWRASDEEDTDKNKNKI